MVVASNTFPFEVIVPMYERVMMAFGVTTPEPLQVIGFSAGGSPFLEEKHEVSKSGVRRSMRVYFDIENNDRL